MHICALSCPAASRHINIRHNESTRVTNSNETLVCCPISAFGGPSSLGSVQRKDVILYADSTTTIHASHIATYKAASRARDIAVQVAVYAESISILDATSIRRGVLANRRPAFR